MLEEHARELIAVVEETMELHAKTIGKIAESLVVCYRQKKMPILFGNGGSFSDTEHFAAEFIGPYLDRNRPALPAVTLSNLAALTANANDFGYEHVFRRLVEAYGAFSTIAIGFSTSGNSPNVIYGFQEARKEGLETVAFTGSSGGKVKEYADILLNVPSDSTPRVQEVHHFMYHEICDIVERTLYPR